MDTNFLSIPIISCRDTATFNLSHLCYKWHKLQNAGTTTYCLLEIIFCVTYLCRHLFEALVILGHILSI